MGSPLGDFLRARRDATSPASAGLPAGARRRVPGLRRSELADLAGISVEYLVRLEQGGDRNPSPSVIASLAEALGLDDDDRVRLRHLATIVDDCTGPSRPAGRAAAWPVVRPTVRALLEQLEPGVAYVTDHLGDVLARTRTFEAVVGSSGLLDDERPNLTCFVLTDPRAREVLPAWEQVADERVAALWLVRDGARSIAFIDELRAEAGAQLTEQIDWHPRAPADAELRWRTPEGELRLQRESLELRAGDEQQLVVLLPADDATRAALARLRLADHPLRQVG